MFERRERGSDEMRTTTVRFDSDLWRDLDVELERLGIARSEYVRIAVREKLIHDRFARLEGRIVAIERFLIWRFVRPSKRAASGRGRDRP